jgi:hypothetical protein
MNMQELFVFGLAISGIFCLLLTSMLLRLGAMIDRFPMGDEENREKSLWSPREFTRISAILFWPLFGIGGFMIFQSSKIVIIGGIAIVIGIVLFLITEVIFSVSVLNLMRSKNREGATPSPMTSLMMGMQRRKTPARKMKST